MALSLGLGYLEKALEMVSGDSKDLYDNIDHFRLWICGSECPTRWFDLFILIIQTASRTGLANPFPCITANPLGILPTISYCDHLS